MPGFVIIPYNNLEALDVSFVLSFTVRVVLCKETWQQLFFLVHLAKIHQLLSFH
jgi:hypothetical protein